MELLDENEKLLASIILACSWVRNAVPACIIMEYNNVFMTQTALWSHRKPECITGSATPCLIRKSKGLCKIGQKPPEMFTRVFEMPDYLQKNKDYCLIPYWQSYWRNTINFQVEILREIQCSTIKEMSLYLNWGITCILKPIETLLKIPKANQQLKVRKQKPKTN